MDQCNYKSSLKHREAEEESRGAVTKKNGQAAIAGSEEEEVEEKLTVIMSPCVHF